MEKTIKNSLFKIVVTNLKFEQRFEQFESKHQIFLSDDTMEITEVKNQILTESIYKWYTFENMLMYLGIFFNMLKTTSNIFKQSH